MSPDVGRLDGPDVLLIAEQLRRAVPGGIGTYVRELVRGIAALPEAERPRLGLLASRSAPPDPLAELGLPLELRMAPSALLVRAWGAGLGRAPDAPLVHAPSFLLPPGHAPLVVTVHDLAFRSHPEAYPRRGRAWHERRLRHALERASAFVVPSSPVAAALVAAGAPAGAVHVIEEGSDHLPAPDTTAARRLLTELGVGGDFLLAVGTLEPRKNLRRLFEAYRQARAELGGDWPLVVVGPKGWGSGPLELPPGVVLAGHVASGVLAALYSAARLLCYVPLEEGFGLPVVEAMRSGTPVLSSDVPSAGGATLLCDPCSVDSIAAGIVDGSMGEARRAELVTAGRARSAALTWRHTAELHASLWRSLLAGAR